MDESTLRIDERTARRLLLVRAIEDVDVDGRVLSPQERESLEQDALEAVRQAARGPAVDRGGYLRQRALKLLAAVAARHPQLVALQDPEPWRRWLAVGLPLAAVLLGAAFDRIGNAGQVNMLSPPLLAVLFWNLLMYGWLLASACLPHPWPRQSSFIALQRWLSDWVRTGRRTGRLSTDVSTRFYHQWLRHTAGQERLWWQQVLHATAAGWAIGLAISIVVGGLVRQYRVGWESTFLDAQQVHAVLGLLFAPVVALTPLDGFSAAEVQRMAFASGANIGAAEARQWVALYLALLGLLVVAPRAALAAAAAWRRRQLDADVRIDLRDPYFVEVLARVSPARVTLGVFGGDSAARRVLQRVLEQVCGRPGPLHATVPWTVIATPKADAVRVFDIPADYEPPPPVKAEAVAGGCAARAWLADLLGRFKAPKPAPATDALQVALGEADLVLLLPARPEDLARMARVPAWLQRPALVLVAHDAAEVRAAVQATGLAADVLDLRECGANWSRDPLLLDAITARLPAGKRAGFARIAETWVQQNHERLGSSMHLLAHWLVRAACEREEVGAGPLSLLRLVSAGERDADHRARQGAMDAVLQRLREAEAAMVGDLMRLQGIDGAMPVSAVPGAEGADRFVLQAQVDTPQAGLAGAASGAAMGAGIDLMTGGLTLGAAAALGAVIGGGAAVAAAAWKNRGAPDGVAQVQLSDEMLQALTERAMLHYLGVVHRGRGSVLQASGDVAAGWRGEVVAAVEAQHEMLAALWRDVRATDQPHALAEPLAHRLEGLSRQLLARV